MRPATVTGAKDQAAPGRHGRRRRPISAETQGHALEDLQPSPSHRRKRPGLSKPELAVFDILTLPEPKLSKAQEVQVKKIAGALLSKLKREKLILDWRMKETAKADVRQTIRELDQLPEVYGKELWDEKVERTYQFVFENFGSA